LNWEKISRLIVALLLYMMLVVSCSSNAGHKLVLNGEITEVTFEEKIDPHEFEGDLNFLVYSDMIPSEWDYGFEPTFYKIEEITSNEFKYLLYAIEHEGRLVDLRLATIKNNSIDYCASLGAFLNSDTTRLIVKLTEEEQVVKFLINNSLAGAYSPNEGKVKNLGGKNLYQELVNSYSKKQ